MQVDYEILIAEVILNAKPTGSASIIAQDSQGNLYVSAEDLQNWKVQAPYPESIEYEGQFFIPLAPLGQLTSELDSDNLILKINLASEAFGKNLIDLADTKIDITPKSGRGFFLNYDLSLNSESEEESNFAAYVDPIAFTEYGHFINRLLYQSSAPDGTDTFLRLESRLQKDFPDKRSLAFIGDGVSAASPWSRQVRFGGIHYGTDFSTQPRFISFPLPITQGEAAVPSDIDIFVNNRLIRSVDTEPGLFEIQNVPTITGDGEIQLIVRDALGRESIISSNFYTSDVLLKKGLSNFGYSLGSLRENFGTLSNDYSDLIAVADHQYGISDNWTIGGRAEYSQDTQNIGANSSINIGNKGIISASAAYSKSNLSESTSDTLDGLLARLSYQYNNERFRLGLGYQSIDNDFRFLGVRNATDIPAQQFNLNSGLRMNRFGSLGIGFVNQEFDSNPNRKITTLNYQTTIPNWFTLSAFVNNISVAGEQSDNSFGLLLTRSFKKRRTASLELSQRDEFQWRSQFRQSLPFGEGYGYRVALGQNPNSELEADWEQKLANFYYSIETRKTENESGLRANLTGSLAKLNQHTSPTRDIRDAFAVIKVADYPNVQVFQENQAIGRTNQKGELLVPGLRPYDINKLRIEPKDLPLDAEINELELVISPYRNSGVLVEFGVERSNSYTLIATHSEFEEIPAGSEVFTINQSGNEELVSVVGYDNLIFLHSKDDISSILLRWDTHECEINLNDSDKQQITNPEAELLELACLSIGVP